MADFNGVKNGNTYLDCKDSTARSSISTIEGLIPSSASASNKLATASDLASKINTSAVGANNGVASLDSTGKVPSSQLPSYVDDVLEYANKSSFPSTGETGKIYIAKDTNKTYRWSGSAYVEISEGLALGETSSTAYAGNKGKANADAITAIKDGSSIDSFGDVETALAGKMPNYGIGIGLYVDSYTNQLRVDAVTKAIKDSPKLITSGAVFSGLSPKYSTAEQEETDLDVQDKFPFYDNSASAKRHTTFGNIKAKLKEYFDSLYVAAVAGKGLSTNDYDNTAKGIVDNIQSNVIANTKLIKDTVGWSGKNLADIDSSEIGTAWNGTPNSARARLIIPVESSKDYILSISGTNALDGVFYAKSASIPASTIVEVPTYPYTITTSESDKYITLGFNKNNISLSDLQALKLMLRDADILDPTYEPYFGSTAFPRSEQAVLGAKNLFNPDAISNMGQFTYSNGEFKNNATDTRANLAFNIQGRKNGTFVKSLLGIDCTATGKYTGVFTISDSDDINQLYIGHSGTSQDIKFILPFTSKGSFRVSFNATGIDPSVVNGIVIKELMFLEPTDTDYTYAPYAMTNRELTEKVKELDSYLEQSVTLSTSDVTTVTFTNAIIQTTSLIEYACSKWGIVPDDITASNGSCVITIPKQSNAETVSIRIYVR